jgi:hypothetical protein
MEKIGAVIAGVVGAIVSLAFLAFVISDGLGVVREYCLDIPASKAAGTVVVDKHWTYVLWPPSVLAANDPPGRCVRNSPLRQGLDAIGLWKLPTPEEQVRRHVVEQLRQGGT